MILTCLALLIGLLILAGGLYYLVREREDRESRRIYTITAAVGAAIVLGTIVKILVMGF